MSVEVVPAETMAAELVAREKVGSAHLIFHIV